MKLRRSLVYPIIGMVIGLSVFSTIAFYITSQSSLMNIIEEEEMLIFDSATNLVKYQLSYELTRIESLSNFLKKNSDIINGVVQFIESDGNITSVKNAIDNTSTFIDADIFQVSDDNGQVIYAAYPSAYKASSYSLGVDTALSGKDVILVIKVETSLVIVGIVSLSNEGDIIGTLMIGTNIADSFVMNLASSISDDVDISVGLEDTIYASSLTEDQRKILDPDTLSYCLENKLSLIIQHPELNKIIRYEPFLIAGRSIGLIIEIDTTTGFQLLEQNQNQNLFILFIILFIALTTGISVSIWIIRPLNKLRKKAEDISSTIAGMDPIVNNRNEIKILASTFDSMVAAMKHYIKKLESSKEKIEQQNIELKKLDEMKTIFLNITSHELRTPITTIKGYTQMLLKKGLDEITEKQKKSLDVILRNANRLNRLIEDILDVSRLQSGTMKFIPTKTDVKKVVDETVESLHPYADFKNIKIHTDVKKGLPQLFIDKERIRQVITNLINNAIKFSPEESIVNVKAKKNKKDVLFEVQDSGRGITRNKQEKVFKLFYQVDSGMDRKFGGEGLGLAISRGIVMAHGGKIWVESKEGEGSNFQFTLPITSIKDIEKQFERYDMFSK